MNGCRLIDRRTTGEIEFLSLPAAMIDYSPKKAYRVEKQNAFDPTYIHRREPYHYDEISITSPVTPAEYLALYAFLTLADASQYYVEYTSNGINKQFPVTITELPACPDDLHEYPSIIKLKMVSRYITTPGYINFDTVMMADDQENIIIVS